MKNPKTATRVLVTSAVVLAATIAVWFVYTRYVERPWTRNGQIRANVVLIAPRISGVVIRVAVADNQKVSNGDLLFEVDPSAYELAVQSAEAQLGEVRQHVGTLEANITVSDAGVTEAEAALVAAKTRIEASAAAVVAAKGRVEGAKAGVTAAGAQVDAAKATLIGFERQFERAEKLANQGAGPAAMVDALTATVAAAKSSVTASEAGVLSARASLDQAKAARSQAEADKTIAGSGLGEATARLTRARADAQKSRVDLGASGDQNVRIASAKATLATAKLNLEWTKVLAPADGYVTNLTVNNGQFAAPGAPLLAFVDTSSFRVAGFFRENQLSHIKIGAKATITMMSHPDLPLEGVVESIGWAINPPHIATIDGPSGLVPQVQPAFDWIRQAQRVPVRIKLSNPPENIPLIVGTTVSVSIDW